MIPRKKIIQNGFRQLLKNQSGASAMLFAIALPILIAGAAMTVELGHWKQKKSKLQNIADMAVIAAAREIQTYQDDADYKNTAKGDTFENGLNFSKSTMSVASPPTSGNYVGRNGVQVSIQSKQNLYFSKFLGQKSMTLEATATALLMNGVPSCILALSTTASPGFTQTGSSIVDVDKCGVHANSTQVPAMSLAGESMTVGCASAAGGITGTPTSITECDKVAEFDRHIPDPYSDITVPANVATMPCNSAIKLNKWDLGLAPGRYCTTVKASGGIYLQSPGTYIFDTADLVTKSTHAILSGSNVTLIFMNGGQLHNTNGGIINLTPPTSGAYAGITLYYDRETTPTGTTLHINGNQSSKIEGVIYTPTAKILVNGGASTTSSCLNIVADTIEMSGNSYLTNTNCEATGARTIGGESGVVLFE